MKQILVFIIVGMCICLNACGDKESAVDNGAKPEEEAHEAISCLPGQTVSGDKCACGDIGMNPEEAKIWTCLGGIWVCLSDDVCAFDGEYYTKWGYLGDRAPGKIPQLPANPAGYTLKTINIPVNKIEYEHRMVWSCEANTCLCGGVQIENGANCIDEASPIYSGVVCGSVTCQMADTCKDGQCWCGETPQTAENVNHYKCENGAPVCRELEGCKCGDIVCPVNAICDVNGCRCGNSKIEKLTGAGKYACVEGDLICIAKDGCVCNEDPCPTKSYCNNQTCTCGNSTVKGLKDASGYICKGESVVCVDKDGCGCGNITCPQKSICTDGMCQCGDEENRLIVPEGTGNDYQCENDTFICHNSNGCACGDTVCPEDGTCENGQCVCGNGTILENTKIEVSDFICSGDFFVCKHDSCKCGDG